MVILPWILVLALMAIAGLIGYVVGAAETQEPDEAEDWQTARRVMGRW